MKSPQMGTYRAKTNRVAEVLEGCEHAFGAADGAVNSLQVQGSAAGTQGRDAGWAQRQRGREAASYNPENSTSGEDSWELELNPRLRRLPGSRRKRKRIDFSRTSFAHLQCPSLLGESAPVPCPLCIY